MIVISGFSGAGKGTLMKRLVEEYDGYALSISATTRKPRPGEKDGREYFFLSREQFEQKIADSALIEYARYCDNYYGTPREYVSTPSAKELRRRLSGRGTETQEVIDQRLRRAAQEAEGMEEYDYIVINDDLETCVRELHEIIHAAHFTPGRNKAFIEKMRKELEEN